MSPRSRAWRFRVWAPEARSVEVVLEPGPDGRAADSGAADSGAADSGAADSGAADSGAPDEGAADGGTDPRRHPLARVADGWHEGAVEGAGPGTRYRYVLDGGEPLPDPRSGFQPCGVHGPSEVVDHEAFPWTDGAWRGLPPASLVTYELHVGTFSPEGTFDGAARRLDHLVDLGVNAVELMPVAQFPGRHGWGYDGVDLYAPHAPYGGPDGLKRLVDAAHGRGLAVVLDVVYNHLGPDGNYLAAFGPYFTDRYTTPWGTAPNLDGPESDAVRDFFCDNALMWMSDYHVDGLRLDAVHAIVDTSAVHFLEQLAEQVERLSVARGRTLFLVAESNRNDPRVVARREVGGYGIDAQWSDDLHHALHVALTGDRTGYYVDFEGLADLPAALRQGYLYDGRRSAFRRRRHGRPAPGIPGHRFVGFLQNHDQVGNRARGERIAHLAGIRRAKVGAALALCAPSLPLLFQGEEWGASSPFLYFTDHGDPALGRAVSEGRRREFAEFGWDPEDVPDPQAPSSFEVSRLDWGELEREPHAEMLDWYRSLLRLRRETPDLAAGPLEDVSARVDHDASCLVLERGAIRLVANLGTGPALVVLPDGPHDLVLASDEATDLAADRLQLPGESVAVLRRA